ncbi:DnaJ C-terminal domain-containing protein [Pedobacter sp. Du54]|uniref:DnaJ C-terminal domain-containing protein n=1 Tax=Pedobacter anseongensis TaxID=3133439 RepID=UPI0030A82555
MDHIDYYKILEIPKTATAAEIKSAYRKLARKYHPDLNPNNKEAEKRFKEINEANEVLSNADHKKKYDEYGKDWKHADEIKNARQQQSRSEGQPFGGRQPFSGGEQFSGEDYSDFFSSMFGGARSHGRQTKFRGQDLNAELQLNLTDVYKSQQQTLTINGKKIRLNFPAGIENGQTIKIKDHGSPGANGGPNGDLYITFSIVNNTKFKREGKNLYSDVALDLYTALLGGEVVVDTFDGKVKLKIPPETQTGTKVKLKGKGFPIYKKENEYGDLFINYQVKLPVSLSDKEKELLKELQKIRNNGDK